LKVLDIGCGAGILAESLTRLGMGSVEAIDPTDKCIAMAEKHLEQCPELKSRLKYKNTTLELLLKEKDLSKSD
jgi:2-polyprenyl-3-methyl-5-hydroxy-6-metoxy-1,4-benzoquinol methylase